MTDLVHLYVGPSGKHCKEILSHIMSSKFYSVKLFPSLTKPATCTLRYVTYTHNTRPPRHTHTTPPPHTHTPAPTHPASRAWELTSLPDVRLHTDQCPE